MVKKIYWKTVWNTLTKNFSRFLVMGFIVFLGIAFVSGLGTLSSSLTDSLASYYQEHEGLDLIVKSTSMLGFSKEEIEQIQSLSEVQVVEEITSIDQDDTRIILRDMKHQSLHNFNIVSGRMIENSKEVLVDRTTDIALYETVSILGEEYTVVGVIDNPTYYVVESEKTYENQDLNQIYYFDSNCFSHPLKYQITDLYVKIFSDNLELFSDAYLDKVSFVAEQIKSENSNVFVLTLKENLSYALAKNYGEKIDFVSFIFPIFFIVVSCLVVYSIITRLILEERSILGCYRSLGISKVMIVFKYFGLSFLVCLLGCLFGFFLGLYLLPNVIYPAYDAMFFMPEMTSYRVVLPGIFMIFLVLIFISIISIVCIWKQMKEQPCNLLRAKTPKAGQKIFLEYIPFLWKHFSFKYKSTFRNVFRYRVNFILTVVSVAGSTALAFAGFGLFSVAVNPNTTEIPLSMADSFAMISLVIILFAAILCILVIFNIANMNVQERTREIASLRVLGYQQKEVCQYIYREINIMTFIGLCFGMPLGYFLLKFLFDFLDFGSMQNVMWYYYFLTIFVVILFAITAELLLIYKIHHVDMNASLKSNE